MEVSITPEQKGRAAQYIELTGDAEVDKVLIAQLEMTRQLIHAGVKNDVTALTLSQSWLYRWQVQMNFRAMKNFFSLRLDRNAHFHIREVAKEMLASLPIEIQDLVNGP